MAQISVKINGFSYEVGCADGQEEHLKAMAAEVNKIIENLRRLSGSGSESKVLMLASLTLADQIHDLQTEIKQLQTQLLIASEEKKPARAEEITAPPVTVTETVFAVPPELAASLVDLADKAEELAVAIEKY